MTSEATHPAGPTSDHAPLPHYRDRPERLADYVVHLTGLGLALFGGGMLLGLAIGGGH